jgi:hypothetical protein
MIDSFDTFRRIDAAFRAGDLDALRAALDDPDRVPNGPMPAGIGSCLEYAIYHSPLAFIRTLLDIGADPNPPDHAGFPPLIAALTCTHAAPGQTRRSDVDQILRLLLASGADPNQRGVNDYTPLHMAVAERNLLAVQILLDAGADADLRTRIDECETALEMAESAGLTGFAAVLARKGRPLNQRMRSGLTLLFDVQGTGEPVGRRRDYRIRLRMWLDTGEPVRWRPSPEAGDRAVLDDHGTTLVTDIRLERRSLINGMFYGIEGMRVGGTRKLAIAPHMAYGDRGVPGVIPAGAGLVAEVTIIEEAQ